MKKLIAISVVFVLLAAAAFAQPAVSGIVYGKVIPFGGSSESDSDTLAGGDMGRIRLELSGQDEDGVFGGWLRFNAGAMGDEPQAFANAWWKPADMVKILIGGSGGDGFFGADGIARWNYYQVGGDIGIFDEHWSFGDSFYKGFSDDGLVVTLTPAEGFEINVAVPFISAAGAEVGDMYKLTHMQVAYTLSGIGKFALTYAGDLGNEASSDGCNGARILAYAGLTLIENVGIDVGIGYGLPVSDAVSDGKYNPPIALGAAVSFSSGNFSLKSRVQGKFAGYYKAGDVKTKEPINVIVDVMPSFAVSDTMSILLDGGIEITKPTKGDMILGWHVEPAVTVKSNWWAPNFYAGLSISSDGVESASGDKTVYWGLPIGIAFSF
jgi:hypothetical protein